MYVRIIDVDIVAALEDLGRCLPCQSLFSGRDSAFSPLGCTPTTSPRMCLFRHQIEELVLFWPPLPQGSTCAMPCSQSFPSWADDQRWMRTLSGNGRIF